MKEKDLSFWEHLEELRYVIFKILIVILVSVVVSFLLKDELFSIILSPKNPDFFIYDFFDIISGFLGLENSSDNDILQLELININLSGQFVAHMTVSFYVGILLSSPYIIYKLFSFVSPALFAEEKKYTLYLLSWGYMLFIIGMLLSYFLIFPLTLRFLATYSVSSEVNNTIQLSSYIDTMVVLSLLMGIVFEIPMIAWLMAKLKLVTSDFMKRYRKHAIVIAFVISAIITPTTDIITLLLVGLPVIVLYEISIFIVRNTAE